MAVGNIGLSSAEVARRRVRYGANELPSARPRGPLSIALSVVREPMFLLLIGAGTIYLVLGDLEEALVLFASIVVVMSITFYQERKTERALQALRDLASPRATVLRDGQWQSIAGRDVVVGDLLLVKEGDRVPADAALLVATNVMADESLLTGESVPVRKSERERGTSGGRTSPGGDDHPWIFSGTLLTRGQGVARVTAIGMRSELGKIGKALQTVTPESSSIERETRRAVLLFATIGLVLCVLVTVLYGVTRSDWLNGLLAGITLAMANLPEEFPVVLTVFLALGAWRLAQQGVLTRRSPAIETLGAATVLCVDKTGTLTQNRMSVRRLWTPVDGADGEAALARLVCLSVLASEREPFDPMEKAFHDLAREHRSEGLEKVGRGTRVHAYPLSPQQLSVAYVWQFEGDDHLVVACKGAPEAVAQVCALSERERSAMDVQVANIAAAGLRVLAVAGGKLAASVAKSGTWPTSQRDLGLIFAGLTGLADPIRPTVPQALSECYQAGLRMVMITGDYPGTAQAIAREIGLARPEAVITGAQLDAMSEPELRHRVDEANVFARVVPEQKLRLVQALKANGQIVAMTGDGVNDAPALKAAHIGVAMGKRGTDVAREAAALVLLEDDFTSLVRAIALGRRIFDNIKQATCYIIAVHVPTAGMALLPLLLGWPLVFYPVHIVFLEFVIDPACSVVFEAEPATRDIMRRPPRPFAARLFDAWTVTASLLQGATLLVAVATLYALALHRAIPEAEARAMAFAAVVLGNLGLILTNRSREATLGETLHRRNRALWWVIGGTLAGLGLALYVTPIRDVFRFAKLGAWQVFASMAAAAAGVAWLELYKALRLRWRTTRAAASPP